MNIRTVVVGLSGALVLGACQCARVGIPDQQQPDASVEDAGLFVPDAGQVGSGLEVAVVSAAGHVLGVRLDGGTRQLIPGDGGAFFLAPRWRPGSDDLAVADGRAAWVLRAGQLRVVPRASSASAPYQGDTARVEWSPNGQLLAIDGTEYSSDARAVFLAPADGGAPELLALAERWVWSTSSDAIYFSRFDSVQTARIVGRLDLASRQETTLLTNANLLDVASTGEPLVQLRGTLVDGGTGDVVSLLAADGGQRVVLADGLSVQSPGEGALASSFAPEFLLRGTAWLSGTDYSYQVARIGLDGAKAVLHESAMPVGAPRCFRFVPGGALSFMEGTVLRQAPRAGGVEDVITPALASPGAFSCVDWHLTSN